MLTKEFIGRVHFYDSVSLSMPLEGSDGVITAVQ